MFKIINYIQISRLTKSNRQGWDCLALYWSRMKYFIFHWWINCSMELHAFQPSDFGTNAFKHTHFVFLPGGFEKTDTHSLSLAFSRMSTRTKRRNWSDTCYNHGVCVGVFPVWLVLALSVTWHAHSAGGLEAQMCSQAGLWYIAAGAKISIHRERLLQMSQAGNGWTQKADPNNWR